MCHAGLYLLKPCCNKAHAALFCAQLSLFIDLSDDRSIDHVDHLSDGHLTG